MIIIGIHDGHNASAALSIDGKIVFAAQEERFAKVKNKLGFPIRTIECLVKQFNLSDTTIDEVAVSTINIGFGGLYTLREEQHSVRDWINEMEEYWKPKLSGQPYDKDYFINLRMKDPKYIPQDDIYEYPASLFGLSPEEGSKQFNEIRRTAIAGFLKCASEKIRFYDHHTCHSYYSYYSNPHRKDPTIGFTIDSFGDDRNQAVWKIENDAFTLLAESHECELGRLYKLTTLYLGMKPLEHEFKVMGLAPYAKAKYSNEVYEELKGILKVDGMRIMNKNRPLDLYQFLLEKFRPYRFDSIAGGVQKYVEEISKELLTNIHKETGLRNFVFGGGVAMNVKLNKALGELDFVDDLFVCGSSSDESLSIGACYLAGNQRKLKNTPLTNLYLGSGESRASLRSYLEQHTLTKKYTFRENVGNSFVAKLLSEGRVVARMAGRMEFGARSLGNRSILANPSNAGIVKEINEMIKGRDFWMPFALTILDKHESRYIRNPKGYESRYMATSFDTKPEFLHEIKAGTHPYDDTVRPQILSRNENPGYYDLIDEFSKITGIGAVLNTSFNLHGLPMVNDIQDAIYVFENSGLNHLLVEDMLLSKP